MKFHHKMRKDSTNVSEESDMCSEVEETIDIENDREEERIPRPSIALRLMRPELDTTESNMEKDRRKLPKCSNYSPACESNIAQRLMRSDFNIHQTEIDDSKSSLAKCSNISSVYESKQINRPSFLITDILSDKKKQCDYDSSVPNTPTSISETLNKIDSHHRIEGVPHRVAAIIQSPRSRSESPSYSEDESREESSPSPDDHQHNLANKAKKQRKARTAFSDNQLNSLEKSFERQKYLSVQDRMELAAKLNLSDTQVKTWYQNRRTKWKRQTAVGLELLAEAGNYATVQRMMQSSPYWGSTYPAHAVNSGLLTNLDSLYYRHGVSSLPSLSSQRHMLSRMYMQNVGHISPH